MMPTRPEHPAAIIPPSNPLRDTGSAPSLRYPELEWPSEADLLGLLAALPFELRLQPSFFRPQLALLRGERSGLDFVQQPEIEQTLLLLTNGRQLAFQGHPSSRPLTQPPDRVSYRMLTPLDEEMQQIADMGLAAGILERRP
jgi:hypothetical protein